MGGEKIQVIDQVNAGVSVARNNGLKRAKGEYIWFIDSDDYIEENILTPLYDFIRTHPCDCCVIGFINVPETGQRITQIDNSKFESIRAEQYDNGRQYAYPWIHIMSRNFLCKHNIQFEPGISHQEDTLWMFYITLFKARFVYTPRQIYAYRMRDNSAMHDKSAENRLKYMNSMVAMLKTYRHILQTHNDKLSKVELSNLQRRIYWSVQNILFFAMRLDKKNRQSMLSSLMADGLYPYPILWDRLSLKYGIKNLIIGLFTLLFPCKWYYDTICYLYPKRRTTETLSL